MTDGNSAGSDSQNKFLLKFKKEVSDGLNSNPRRLPSKYFYDAIGDELFVKIMNLPEYYLTRSEMEIFSKKTDELIEYFGVHPDTAFELIELGAGDGTKTIKLLQRLIDRDFEFEYHPVDISQHALEGLHEYLKNEIPSLKIQTQRGDYFSVLAGLKESKKKKIVLFLGSNIGNMPDERAADFIYKLGSNLIKDDVLLLGVDLIKPAEIVLPAYNDAQGVTAAFNLNLLTRLNKELEANFNLDHWSHAPQYSEETGIAESFLRSEIDQEVYIKGIGQDFFFEKGELIQTEISRKYNEQILLDLISGTDFKIKGKVLDSKKFFADYLLIRQ